MDERGLLREELKQVRENTDRFFLNINPEAMYERPIPERHRLIFYLGHIEAFDWNQLCRWTLERPSFHPTFDRLFEAGIDPAEGDIPIDSPLDWPSLQEVKKYNYQVRQQIDEVFDELPEDMLHIAIEHRLMHAETNAYLLHHLDRQHKAGPSKKPGPASHNPGSEEMVGIPEGLTCLGRNPREGFGWDNEFARHESWVPAFSISRYKISNEQYLRFVREGGDPPAFWLQRGNDWWLRTMFEEVPLPMAWPVYVTHRQAQAFAEWRGMRLPSEAEFHRAAYGTPSGTDRPFPWGVSPPGPDFGNFNFQEWDPVPVTTGTQGESAFGVAQLVGNGWEWTSTIFHPFEGFDPIPTYPGYSARFFDQDHYVVKGAGPQTSSRLLRRSFRNWFRQGYSHAHTAFRCVKADG